jgi:hypothetical protein
MPPTEDDLRRVAESAALAREYEILAAKPPRDPYTCVTCLRTFPSTPALHRHWDQERHTPLGLLGVLPIPTVRCAECCELFLTAGERDTHRATRHPWAATFA